MKTLVLIVCAIFISTVALAQQNRYDYKLKPGILYVSQNPEGELIIEGYPPSIDPWASFEINPAYLTPIDNAGPIGLDPTAIKRINPNHVFYVDRMYPEQSPLEPRTVNPANPIEKKYPGINDPWSARKSNPYWNNNWD
jgi:hypothetical protein